MGQYGKHWPLVRVALFVGVALLASPVSACRLALVLAMDVSASVDATEDQLQRQGLAAALMAPQVQEAFFASPDPVAVAAFEWSGRYNQQQLADWRLIRSPADLLSLSQAIAQSPRSHDDFPTAMGHALGHSALQLQDAPACLFQTIDLAGDGENNEGFGPAEAYAAFPFDNVVVNGLVVTAPDTDSIIPYYRTHVLRGPGAFLEVANGFDDYQAAMERKLIRELSAQVIGRLATQQEVPG